MPVFAARPPRPSVGTAPGGGQVGRIPPLSAEGELQPGRAASRLAPIPSGRMRSRSLVISSDLPSPPDR